jgi:hypothetical protein
VEMRSSEKTQQYDLKIGCGPLAMPRKMRTANRLFDRSLSGSASSHLQKRASRWHAESEI